MSVEPTVLCSSEESETHEYMFIFLAKVQGCSQIISAAKGREGGFFSIKMLTLADNGGRWAHPNERPGN